MRTKYFLPTNTYRRNPLALCVTAAILGVAGTGYTLPALAQKASSTLEEVVVQARRVNENLQDVPISMTVFNQQQLDDANITNPSDLATYTPSLQMNYRFGEDNATFAIRGFSQELRTTSSVGVYFAEVIAPRGANATSSGDGASPGDLFDLASVQVLKGPQGTLFGRNTTGGAILIVPQKPTGEFEGYLQLSAGDFDMEQQQLVINTPITDSFKLRLGIDHKERSGYLNNFSGIGPDDFGNIDYTSYRLSALWDITDSLENYTILKYMESSNNGYVGSVLGCLQGKAVISPGCIQDLARREAAGNNGFYDVYNSVDPVNEQESYQIIDTLTWSINDQITLKNTFSYANLVTRTRMSIFGENFIRTDTFQPLTFQQVGLADDMPTTDQETYVEEIQLQGMSFEGKLSWQAGLYFEKSRPGGEDSGAQSPALITCDQDSITVPVANADQMRCRSIGGQGSVVVRTEGAVEYFNQAVYFQGTYDFTESLSFDVGLRYTKDKTEGWVTETAWKFLGVLPPGTPLDAPIEAQTVVEKRNPQVESEAPTWLLGVNYQLTEETMLYAKYSRGYRQGSVNIAGTGPYQFTQDDWDNLTAEEQKRVQPGDVVRYDEHDPETVDAYEIGAKNQFEGIVPGTFNIAAFYNDFTDQQIQYGYLTPNSIGTTAIFNAGKSTIWGVEADTMLHLPGDITLTASYSHLETEVKELEAPIFAVGETINDSSPTPSLTTAVGEPLSYVPKNQLVTTLAWLLPFSPELGDIKASVTYVYTDTMQATARASSAFYLLPANELWNLNLGWNSIFGSNFDFSAFVTNVKDEEYITYISGTYNNGMEVGRTGQPRMYGARIKYSF